MSLSLDEFSDPDSCIRQNAARRTIDIHPQGTARLPISRGTHVVEIPISWPNDIADGKGESTKRGTISFQSSMWTDHPEYRFLTRSFGTQYCERFSSP